MTQPIETTTRLVGPTGDELLLQIIAAAIAAAEAHEELATSPIGTAGDDMRRREIIGHLQRIHRAWMDLEHIPGQAELDVRRKLRGMVRGLR